jgi:hypothetical protein
MRRHVRALLAVSLSLPLSVLASPGMAQAQEMEHGRTRPAGRELKSNVVKSQEAIANVYISNVRG